MKRRLVLSCMLLFPSWSAFAQPAVGTQVSISGCPYKGVETGCIMIDSEDGVTYNITGADPPIDLSQQLGVSLTGTVSDKVSICMQGTVLDPIEYELTKQVCPLEEQK